MGMSVLQITILHRDIRENVGGSAHGANMSVTMVENNVRQEREQNVETNVFQMINTRPMGTGNVEASAYLEMKSVVTMARSVYKQQPKAKP